MPQPASPTPPATPAPHPARPRSEPAAPTRGAGGDAKTGARAARAKASQAPASPHAKPGRAAAARIEGVDVADVGDAIAGGLRTGGATLVSIVTALLSLIRAVVVASARGLAAAWPMLTHVVPRLAWWGALALLVAGGTALLDAFAPPEHVAWIPTAFIVGLTLAILPAYFARAMHVRAFGVTLAAAHASALLLVWMTQAG
jgi:hypothetical protein